MILADYIAALVIIPMEYRNVSFERVKFACFENTIVACHENLHPIIFQDGNWQTLSPKETK